MDSAEAQKRYAEKIAMCKGFDPLKIKTSVTDVPLNVTFAQIYQFMVLDPNPFTGHAKDSTKGMEAILYFKNGWVKKVAGKKIQNVFIIHGTVHHSFSLNDPPLCPWIVVEENGTILAAHCTCAIGILESCSHVGATLFALDGIRVAVLEQKLSVTDLPAYWKKPPSINQELYKKIRDINFGKRVEKFYPSVESVSKNDPRYVELLQSMQEDGINCAATSVFCGESNCSFLCKTCNEEKVLDEKFQTFDLTKLYNPSHRQKPCDELLKLSQNIYQNMDNDPHIIHEIEVSTSLQNESQLWMKLRCGRITASVLKDVCHTTFNNPSLSVVKQICYPNHISFSSPAIQYGRKYEFQAVSALFQAVEGSHTDLKLLKSGLHLSQENPCLGASPDAILHCRCHGIITVEVKCPYSSKDADNLRDVLLKLKDRYVDVDEHGNIVMNTRHKYYYQTLMQVHICKATFGYFYIWSPKDTLLFQVKRNETYWTYCRDRAILFFKNVILLELLAKTFTDRK
ncbi:uncharacterized protein LOC131690590 [Topomyia yanbarensis]|uniref:uncharacterized protein LOC131690590 n=1 Tax=Topomyia yanbarensis TaxID=2498891 RepID=UPI00273BC9E3|nr:uncharacterized protein LOC131690590 [Topomyia yanbarensis]